ncbi:unnamed protein product [Durusdinium trenchii]|uniref:AB hydrolase-1 domain-containing protein n=1 Tax=Durusdinium trenchii TaxID=1381693 RepID=A0ABP0M5D7_9DINO
MAESSAHLRMVEVNGIRMRIAEEGDPSQPLVLLLHGWPEFWYSWRWQLKALANASYYAVAPDLRGFGQTEAPLAVEDYDCDFRLDRGRNPSALDKTFWLS